MSHILKRGNNIYKVGNNVFRYAKPVSFITNAKSGFNVPIGLAIDEPNNRMFLANLGTDTIYELDLVTKNTISIISGGFSGIRGLTIDPVNNVLIAANYGGAKVSIIDLNTLLVIHTITGVFQSVGITVDLVYRRLIISSFGNGTLLFYDLDTYVYLYSISGNYDTLDLAVDKKYNRLFSFFNAGVAVLDLTTLQMITSISTGYECMHVCESENLLFLGSNLRVSVYSLITLGYLYDIGGFDGVRAIEANLTGSVIFGANINAGTFTYSTKI